MKKIYGRILKNNAVLKLNWFEAGILRALLEKHDEFRKLPRAFQLKLDILFATAYLEHDTLAKQAKKDIAEYKAELAKLEPDEEDDDIIQKN